MNSIHFTIDEFRCKDGTDYPAEWVEDRLAALCGVLDTVRDAWGGPLTVVCGYRTAAYNARLAANSANVAKNSQHVQGRAADVRPANPTRERVAAFHDLIVELYRDGRLPRLGGLGFYPGLWCHLDTRQNSGHLATWVGAGVGSEP